MPVLSLRLQLHLNYTYYILITFQNIKCAKNVITIVIAKQYDKRKRHCEIHLNNITV